MNIRHDLDPVKVKNEIDRTVEMLERQKLSRMKEADKLTARYEEDVRDGTADRNWGRAPTTSGQLEQIYNDRIETQKQYYSKVRVIELPVSSDHRFVLAYGGKPDSEVTSGTGLFESVEKAAQWFFNNGR